MTGAGAAVDAHYYAGIVYDYYKTHHARLGIDGNNGAIVASVHFQSRYDNAFWDGTQMVYGDGDGTTFKPLSEALDVTAHELTHAVTSNTANLTYSGESGGLNEAMSDIMGKGVEWYASKKNPNEKFSWVVGHDIWTPNDNDPNDGLRYMNDPTKDNYSVEAWNYLWTENYGSPEVHLDDPAKKGHDQLDIASVTLSPDARTVFLEIPGIRPAMQVKLRYDIAAADGAALQADYYSTINRLGETDGP